MTDTSDKYIKRLKGVLLDLSETVGKIAADFDKPFGEVLADTAEMLCKCMERAVTKED